MNAKEVISDGEIVSLFFERSESAIDSTDKKYGAYLLRFAFSILADERDSEECRNDVYLALWNSIPPDRPQSFKAYVTRIMRNLAIDRYRRNHSQKEGANEYALGLDELYECFSSASGVEKEVEDRALSALLNRFVRSLGKQDRYIFVARFYLCKPVKEIAANVGKSETTVFNRLTAVKKKLAKELRKEGFEDA